MALTFAKIGSQFFKMLNNPSKIVKDFQNFANTGHSECEQHNIKSLRRELWFSGFGRRRMIEKLWVYLL